ncbi:MAG TPA: M48 family metallopeptidase [Rhizomicrobium sp.]|nr:M48 family metallopeptidase [Rhizomicrobium sp.]
MIVKGTFFPAGSSRAVPADASIEARQLRIVDETGAVVAEFPLGKARVSARLGNLRRRIEFPDHSRFETDDNDGIDMLFREAGRLLPSTMLHWIESSLKWVAAAVIIAGVSTALMIIYGFPAAAAWLAFRTPHVVLVTVSDQTLATMDRFALAPSELSTDDKIKAQRLFARVAAMGHEGRSGYQLLFREGRHVGPNAFSLPDGRVVMTDQLYEMVKRDDELEGVFGHEIAHADRRHAMQMVYEASLLPATIALVTGDASQLSQITAVLPTLLIESSYSRSFEQQADDDSANTMKRIGADPAALGEFLLRMDKEICGRRGGCGPSWLGSHPATAERAARLRAEGNAPRR